MKQSVVRRALQYMRAYRAKLAGACVLAVMSVLFSLLGPVFIGRAVDAIVSAAQVDYRRVLLYLTLLAGSALLAAVAQWALQVLTRQISSFAARDLREQAFAKLNNAPLQYLDSHAHGDLISSLINDAELVSEGFLQGLTQLLPGVATIAGTLIVMLVQNAAIALTVLLLTPISVLFAGFVAKRTAGYFKQKSAAQGAMLAFVQEHLAGQAVVKAFGNEARTFEEFDTLSDALYISGYKSVFYSAATNPGTRFVNAVVYVAVAVLGAFFALRGIITVGQLSSFLAYANQYTKPFNEISGVVTQLQSAQAGAQRLFALIDAPQEQPDAKNALAPKHCDGQVEMQHVSFSYVPQVPLIQDFCLTVQPGMRVAIVGPTGCGKTTLINLLMRFYDVNSGAILVDGNKIESMQRRALRGLYGMVLQETWLKNASVRDNIAYGRPKATLEEICAAAKKVHAHGFIKRLAQGYDTIIEPGGGNLSAGQRQLLCIARIMLCQPDMLILDEATSSIDTRTEMLVQTAFETLMQGRTSFVVAHRLSTIRTADMILVMQAGHIVEQGTHEALLQKNGFYAKLYQSQFEPA